LGKKTIHDLSDKTATTIANTQFENDSYHNWLRNAAQFLVNRDFGHVVYVTQHNFGVTVWRDEEMDVAYAIGMTFI
jgi:hypothetical protein